jgi:hypothetical protein
MGGTSTDVAHYAGELERSFETEVAGVRMRVPMMNIHTVAAGGGSVLIFDGMLYRVGQAFFAFHNTCDTTDFSAHPWHLVSGLTIQQTTVLL